MPLPALARRPLSPRLADVRAVLVGLKARRRQTERDSRIADRVLVAFERLRRSDVSDLHFYVFEGAVSVYGTVLTHEHHAAVLADLSALPGVRRVADHLRVQDRRPKQPFTIRPVAFEAA